jgi:GT2 family glycosyltransferase
VSRGSRPVRPSTSLGVGTVGIDRSLEALNPPDFGRVSEWRLVVTLDGRPVARLEVPDPGAVRGPGFLRAAVVAAADQPLRRQALARSLRERMGARPPEFARREVSVVVCTHRRREHLAEFLRAAAALDPAPFELVVVDNAPPPGEDCEDLVRAAGAVYVREDRRGLNNARTAGVRAATGELVAFTDDDCRPPSHWLAALDELFDDPSAGAVTGPAFPAFLDTPSEARFEEVASFVRRLDQHVFDFLAISPADANHTGAGANMVMRRSLLLELGDPFPPELDAGTATESGGDLYALYRVLAAGRRIVYDPRVFTYHAHRAEPGALHRAVYGYGVGLSAATTKLLLEERELAALRIWRWLLEQYVEGVVRGLTGGFDPVRVRVAWDYLRGGLAGPVALMRSRREQGPATRLPEPRPYGGPATAAGGLATGAPELSAIVITHRRPAMAARCLEALAAQRQGTPPFEVVLVDDSPDGLAGSIERPAELPVRVVRTGGAGAATARNAGVEAARAPLLLFLDDDLLAGPGLVASHAERHRDAADRVVVGYSRPRPTLRTHAAISAAIWWEDHFRAKRDALAPAFSDVLSGNMSVRRETFDRIGAFDTRFGRWRREDWDWGIRALGAGVELLYAPDAEADHRYELTTRGRLDAARAEGHGDALLIERYPSALPAVHAGRTRPRNGARSRVFHELCRFERPRAAVALWLETLERLRSRRTWARWWDIAQAGAYEQGFAEGMGSRAAAARHVRVVPVDVDGHDPLPLPEVAAPVLELRAAGRPAARVLPPDGHWNAALADRAANTVPPWALYESDGLAPGRAPAAPAGLETHPLADLSAGAWRGAERALESASAEAVALLLPGTRADDRWLAIAADPLDGERVAAVFGTVHAVGALWPVRLWTRAAARSPYSAVGRPPSYLLLRREAWAGCGGFHPAALAAGGLAPLLDAVERLLDAGLLVGQCDVPGEAARGSDWGRVQAQGALIGALARERGADWALRRAAAPALLREVARWRAGRRKRAVASVAALAVGIGRGVRSSRPER